MAPQRIVIVGSPGSGKSRLARKLGAKLGLPVIHLDTLCYLPGWKKSPLPQFRARVEAAHAGEAWISEGNFASWTFDLRLPRAQAFIAIRRPRWLCLWRAIRRAVTERRDRPDLPQGCAEQIDRDLLYFIWSYPRRGAPEMEAARREHAPALPTIRLGSDSAIAAFLNSPRFPAALAETEAFAPRRKHAEGGA